MPVFLQILLGASPLILMSVIIMIRKKAIVLPGLMVIAVIAAAVFGLINFDLSSASSGSESEAAAVTKEQLLYIAQCELAEGDTDEAQETLSELYQSFGDDAQAALISARAEAAEGDLDAALALYHKACSLDSSLDISDEEASYFALIEDGSLLTAADAASLQAQTEYLTEQGLDASGYGYSYTDEDLDENSQLLTAFQEYIIEVSAEDAENAGYSKKSREAADAVIAAAAELSQLTENLSGSIDYSSDAAAELEAELDIIEEYIGTVPEMAAIESIDSAIVGAYELLCDAEGLIYYTTATGSLTGYSAIADLYVQGGVDADLLGDDLATLSEEQYRELAAACEKAAQKIGEDSVTSDIDVMIEVISDYASELVLCGLGAKIDPSGEVIEAQSKLYLVRAMIYYALGNSSKGEEYLAQALSTAPYSTDSEYSAAMQSISAVVNGTADSEDIKNVEDYLTEAYKLALPAWTEYTAAAAEEDNADSDEADDTYADAGSSAVSLSYTSVSTVYAASADAETEAADAEEADEDTDDTISLSDGISTDFIDGVSTYATTAQAMMTISSIDASYFPEVTFRLQTADELDTSDPGIDLWDCGISIDDYSISEVTYDGAKVALVCDNSGSMQDSVEDLQAAVQKYIEDLNEGEQVSIVAFSDSVTFSTGFSGDASYFASYISQLSANGGTNIYSGVSSAIESLKSGSNIYKAIIVLTDGVDSSFSSSDLEELGETCNEYGITLYTIGLGDDVETDYLSSIASAGNGQFVYCSSISQLETLYAFIHSQMNNSYEVTFTAENTEWSERTITVESTADGSLASADYSIDGTAYDEDGARITSVDSDAIYKKEAEVTFNLLGENFSEDTSVSVVISGDMGRYTLTAAYADETHILVTVPGDVPVGTYTLTATADQSEYECEMCFYSEYSELTFGAYTFTAGKISYSEKETVLSGDVVMNGYIHFMGSITLEGDVENDLSVTLVDESGSAVTITDDLSELFEEVFGRTIYLDPFDSVTIYDDEAHMNDLDEYKVQAFNYAAVSWSGIIFEGGTASLYPHMLSGVLTRIEFSFPLQKDIMKYNGYDTPFTAEVSLEVLVVPAGLRAAGKVSYSTKKDFKLLSRSFYLSKFELEFNTFDNDYSLEMAVTSDSLVPTIGNQTPDKASYGFTIEIKSGVFDTLEIKADAEVVVCVSPPISLSDFRVGVSGLSSEDQTAAKLLAATWYGSCDVNIFKLKDKIPIAESIFGELALFSMDDTTIELRLSDFMLNFDTTAKFLGVELGNATVTLGNHTYSNYLLDIADDDVVGFYTNITAGPKLDLGNWEILLQASFDITMNGSYSVVWANGTLDYDISFIKHMVDTVDGDLIAFVDHENSQCTIIIKGQDLELNAESGVKITLSGNWPSITFY